MALFSGRTIKTVADPILREILKSPSIPIGILWNWGGWKDIEWYVSLTSAPLNDISNKHFSELRECAKWSVDIGRRFPNGPTNDIP